MSPITSGDTTAGLLSTSSILQKTRGRRAISAITIRARTDHPEAEWDASNSEATVFCNGNPPYNAIYSCKGVTTFPSQQYGTGEAFSRAAITAEAQYRAIYTANQMGTETPVPTYIYVIGLGADITTPSTEAFLATLANDSSGLWGNTFNPARPAGGFYPVPNCPSPTCTASLNAVFQMINARILP